MEKSAKIVFIGQAGVGKTSILLRFINSPDKDINYISPTIAAAFNRKKVTIGNQTVYLDFWDTSGQERYYSISKIYFRRSTCCILVFDINDQNSFNQLNVWKSLCDDAHNDTETLPAYFLVGNKIDKNKNAISRHIIESWCENNNICDYIETSALTSEGISTLLDKIVNYLEIHDCFTYNNSEIKNTESTISYCHC